MIMMTVVDHLYCNMVLSVVVVKLLQEILLKRETLNVSIIVSLGAYRAHDSLKLSVSCADATNSSQSIGFNYIQRNKGKPHETRHENNSQNTHNQLIRGMNMANKTTNEIMMMSYNHHFGRA